MKVERAFGDAFGEEWSVTRYGTFLLVFVTVRRREIATIYRTINGNFALRSATNGADFFHFCGAKTAFFSLFTNRTRQTQSPG